MQNTLFPKFALYRLRLRLELGARRQTLPAYLCSTVRGMFAASFRQVPRPYIFEAPLIYRGEEPLERALILVRQGLDFLPYFLYVVQETGKSGLGRARVPYRLLTVTDGSRADGPVIFQAEAGIVRDDVQALTLEDLQHPDDGQVQQGTLEFLTPLRVKKYGGYQEGGERIAFATLIDLLLGRIAFS